MCSSRNRLQRKNATFGKNSAAFPILIPGQLTNDDKPSFPENDEHVRQFGSQEELDHDYLWRAAKRLPQRGRIGIFNRSYYEEVLVVRVHPELLAKQHLPPCGKEQSIWKHRFEEINCFERYLVVNGTIVLKLFLNISKKEQKVRFLKRIEEKEKNWKFSATDVLERRHWAEYRAAYEDMFNHTSTDWAPWFIVPADHKWFTHLCVSEIIVATLKSLGMKYPKLSDEQLAELEKAKEGLLDEK
jgi:PPK2 family polyphosphate:nucleotide phosphotransferase